jgi:hypothetical protein
LIGASPSHARGSAAGWLNPLREFATAQGWQVAGEFTDTASANDLGGRTAWRRLLDDAARRRVDMIVV